MKLLLRDQQLLREDYHCIQEKEFFFHEEDLMGLKSADIRQLVKQLRQKLETRPSVNSDRLDDIVEQLISQSVPSPKSGVEVSIEKQGNRSNTIIFGEGNRIDHTHILDNKYDVQYEHTANRVKLYPRKGARRIQYSYTVSGPSKYLTPLDPYLIEHWNELEPRYQIDRLPDGSLSVRKQKYKRSLAEFFRINSETRLIQEWGTYDYYYKTPNQEVFSIGSIPLEVAVENEPPMKLWYPKCRIKVKYKDGYAQYLDVNLVRKFEIDTVRNLKQIVPVQPGTQIELHLRPGDTIRHKFDRQLIDLLKYADRYFPELQSK